MRIGRPPEKLHVIAFRINHDVNSDEVIMRSKHRSLNEKLYSGRYKKLRPTNIKYSNTCFYCGDIMNEHDHLPSISNVHFFDMINANPNHILVPSCKECNLIAGSSLDSTLEERMETINIGLEKKYKKNIIASMKDIETDYMSSRLRRSVELYSELGRSALDRIKFIGFDYEIDGHRNKSIENRKTFESCGEMFETATEAVVRACQAYNITIELFMRESRKLKGESIDKVAISASRSKFIDSMYKQIKSEAKKINVALPRATLEKHLHENYLTINIDPKKELDIFMKRFKIM